MKTTLKASFMSLLLLATIAFNGPVFAEDEYCFEEQQPCDTQSEWSSSWDDSVCWDNNDWSCWDYDECCDKNFRVYVGGLYYNRRFHLKNDHNDRGLNIFSIRPGQKRSVQGNFGGVNVGAEYDPLCFVYGRVDFWWGTGPQHGHCLKSNVNEYWVEGRVGWTWGECSPCGWRLTPYSGIGYFWIDRRFNNVFFPVFNHLAAFRRGQHFKINYQSWYVPVGIRGEVELMPDFTAGVDVTWMPEFGSRIQFGKHESIELNHGDFGDRYGWRVEVPLRYLLPCDWDIEVSVVPFWQQLVYGGTKHQLLDANFDRAVARRNLRIDPSSVKFGLPKAREDYWGAKFLVGLKF